MESTSFETASSLPLDAVDALAVFGFGGDDGEAHLLAHRAAQETGARCAFCHPVAAMICARVTPSAASSIATTRAFLLPPASAPSLLRSWPGTSSTGIGSTKGGRLWACFQMRLMAVARSLNFRMGGHARKCVPDLDQAARRPIARDFRQLLFGVECRAAFGGLRRCC